MVSSLLRGKFMCERCVGVDPKDDTLECPEFVVNKGGGEVKYALYGVRECSVANDIEGW